MARRLRSDTLIAAVLALLLGLVWTIRASSDLGQLRLPDTDDVMRLAQIRDWLAGQPFGDLRQHRLAGGLPMHWTRLADLGPAAIIVALRPLLGSHTAEVIAVTVWPIVLFAVALRLVIRIARRLGGERVAATAGVIAALAYPATTVFLPGRIDHHGLQLVLLLAGIAGLLARDACGAALAGGCTAASLIVGLETAPLLALAGLWLVAGWARHRVAGATLAAFALGLLLTLIVGRALFASADFAYPACDGLTRIAWRAFLAPAGAVLLLALLDRLLTGHRLRWVAVIALGGGAVALGLALSPQCLHPYGAVDPRIAALWLNQVGEAQSIRSAPVATSFGYAGLPLVGFAATLWQMARRRGLASHRGTPGDTASGMAAETRPGWELIALLLAGALAITAVQLRGAYPAALLAAPALAAMVAAARDSGPAALVASWLAAAGILYPLAARALPSPTGEASVGRGDCGAPAMIATLDRLPPGRVIAPVDAGAWIIGGTQDTVLAAPYHRDGAGLRAVYAFYAAPAGVAAATADRLGAHYLLACAALPGAHRRGSAAAALARGTLPGFATVAVLPDGARIIARNRLSGGAPPA
ncbi:hypothetical protein [Sphingomonas sp. CV7422]|uniref:hypothetical protein n=1 Tax=Sphingomonas sp. CV7422 TaxID=3018036 RepID=UPI0022FE6F98|nr:hypothetical protein [Sphingomonas sp. CV7422]